MNLVMFSAASIKKNFFIKYLTLSYSKNCHKRIYWETFFLIFFFVILIKDSLKIHFLCKIKKFGKSYFN